MLDLNVMNLELNHESDEKSESSGITVNTDPLGMKQSKQGNKKVKRTYSQ